MPDGRRCAGAGGPTAQENKRLKEEAKAKAWEEDQKLMAQYAEMLERQERARKEQLERLKAVQARQAADAASRPEAKTWIDPAIIDKYLRCVPSPPGWAVGGGRRQLGLCASRG